MTLFQITFVSVAIYGPNLTDSRLLMGETSWRVLREFDKKHASQVVIIYRERTDVGEKQKYTQIDVQ